MNDVGNDMTMHRWTTQSVLLAIAAWALLTPGAALAQVLIGETSARFDWDPASGDVGFYQVFVSRSTRGGSYELEQTVSTHSVTLDAGVGEVVRVRVRAGNDLSFGPLSLPSDAVRFGLPPQLPVFGTPGVFQGRASGSDTGFIFYADPQTGDVWRFSATDASAPAELLGTENDDSWELFASGDFDGDGVADLFWRHDASGATRIWFLQGNGYSEEVGPLYPGADWSAEITGDFDGNGQDDVLWRSDAGHIRTWFRTGTEFTYTIFPPMPTDTIELVASGDFDGDGVDDIFWRDVTTTGTLVWFMAVDPYNGSYAQTRTSSRRSMLWEVFEVRDENGDGTDDVHWRMKSSHDLAEWWLMDGEVATAQ